MVDIALISVEAAEVMGTHQDDQSGDDPYNAYVEILDESPSTVLFQCNSSNQLNETQKGGETHRIHNHTNQPSSRNHTIQQPTLQ